MSVNSTSMCRVSVLRAGMSVDSVKCQIIVLGLEQPLAPIAFGRAWMEVSRIQKVRDPEGAAPGFRCAPSGLRQSPVWDAILFRADRPSIPLFLRKG